MKKYLIFLITTLLCFSCIDDKQKAIEEVPVPFLLTAEHQACQTAPDCVTVKNNCSCCAANESAINRKYLDEFNANAPFCGGVCSAVECKQPPEVVAKCVDNRCLAQEVIPSENPG